MYYGGDVPADALGRFARQVERSGALSLGAGIGVERRGARDDPKYAVIAAAGEAKVHAGPLAAVTDAFTRAGVLQQDGTPGGKVEVKDATIAARLYELEQEERQANERLAQRPNGVVWNTWEQERRADAEATIERVRRERAKLMRQNRQVIVAEAAEVGKPGTNFTQVSPSARKRINPIVQHYAEMAHPFTACVRDNTKRFGQERAERICAVVKDMARGTTKWRKGGVREEEAERVWRGANRLAEEALQSLDRAASVVGRRGVRRLVQEALKATADDGSISEAEEHQLGEHLLADLVVLEWVARPRDGEIVWRQLLHEPEIAEAYRESEHPRRRGGEWTEKGTGAGGVRRVTAATRRVEKSKLTDVLAKHPGVSIEATERDRGIVLSMIRTEGDSRGKGQASAAMRSLTEHADATGQTIALTPDPVGSGGMSKAALTKWYRSHGFVPNSGRNKDYAFREAMLRLPKTKRK